MFECLCGNEMYEVSRDEKKAVVKCEECGKQKSVFIKREVIRELPAMDWKSRCMHCKKIFIGQKRYCSIKCWRFNQSGVKYEKNEKQIQN